MCMKRNWSFSASTRCILCGLHTNIFSQRLDLTHYHYSSELDYHIQYTFIHIQSTNITIRTNQPLTINFAFQIFDGIIY